MVPPACRQGLPVGLPVDGMAAVAGHHGERGRQAPVGDRHPGVGGHRDRRGDAGHHLERHAGGLEGQGLLPAPSEHEGVAALQADDRPPGPALADQEGVDLVLVDRTARRLADVDPPGGGRGQVEEAGVGQPVVDDHVGAAEHLGAAHGQQPGVAGAGADQVDGHGGPTRRARRVRRRRPPDQVGAAGAQEASARAAPSGHGQRRSARSAPSAAPPARRPRPPALRSAGCRRRAGAAAKAPTGRSQPPPRRARKARSAVTAVVSAGVVDGRQGGPGVVVAGPALDARWRPGRPAAA